MQKIKISQDINLGKTERFYVKNTQKCDSTYLYQYSIFYFKNSIIYKRRMYVCLSVCVCVCLFVCVLWVYGGFGFLHLSLYSILHYIKTECRCVCVCDQGCLAIVFSIRYLMSVRSFVAKRAERKN